MTTFTSLRALKKALHDATICKTCGKAMLVRNLAGYRQPVRLERVTRDTHCVCPGGPAAHLLASPPDVTR